MVSDNHEWAERAQPESERWFQALVQNALDIVMVTEADGTIRYMSPSVERVLGYTPEEMVGTNSAEYVHPEDLQRAFEELEVLLSKPGVHPVAVETRVRHKDGSWRHLEGIATNLLDDAEVQGLVFNHRDITDRVRAEMRTRAVELRYRTLVEQVPAIVYIENVETQATLYDSPQLEVMLGYPSDTCEKDPHYWEKILHPDDRERVMVAEREAAQHGEFRLEYRVFASDGRVVWLRDEATIVRDEAGEPLYWQGVIFDITQRRRTDEEVRRLNENLERQVAERTARLEAALAEVEERERGLQESEERFRATFEQAAVGVAHVGPDGKWLRVNNKLCEITGYPREQLLGMTFQDITHRDDLEADLEQVRRLLAGEIGTYSMEKRYLKKDGSIVWINLTVSLVRDANAVPKYFISVIEDISERKQAREALRQSEERYRAVVKQSAEGIYLVDGDSKRILETNPALQNMLGYSADELRGMELHEIVAHDRQSVEANIERTLKEGKRFIRERRCRRKDGSVVVVEIAASAIYYGGKQIICAAIRDITERKRADETLERQARQAALRADVGAALAEGGPLRGVLQRCAEAMVRHIDAAFARVWTLNEEEDMLELQASAGMYTHIDGAHSRVPVGSLKIGLIAQERKPHLTNTVTTDARVSDKEWARRERMVAFVGYPLVVEDRLVGVMAMSSREELADNTLELLGSVADVIAQGIERKRTEEALRESEERFRLLAEEAMEGIALVENGKVIDVNRSFLKMFGYDAEELVGMDVVKLVAPDSREEVARRLSTGNTRPYEARVLKKDGTVFPIEVRPRRIPYHGRWIRVTSVIDLTERKRAEEAMREVREAERRRIARDLHDGVLQNLSYTVWAMQLTKLQVEGTGVEEEFQQEVDAIRSAVLELRAAVHDLRLADELDQPFPRLLESLVERNRQIAPDLEIRLNVEEGPAVTPLGESTAELLRVIQEALTNTRRHSAARHVSVTLSVEGDKLTVEIADDGRGFGPGITPGVGLRSMRERAASLSGELTVESEPGEGTTVRLRIPMPRWR